MVTMTSFHIEKLPTELVQKVVSYLDRASLLSFSLVDKLCHSYATTRLFKTIYIYLWDPNSLVEQIQRWSAVLTRYYAHALVQEIVLVDGSPPVKGLRNPYMRVVGAISHIDEIQLYQDAGDLRTWSEEIDSMPVQSSYRGIKEDTAWTPLSDFVSQLPSMSLLTCASSNQLSDNVIEMLCQAWPGLRLQMFNTSLVNDSYLPILRPSMAPFLKGILVKLSPGLSEHRGISQLDFIIHNAAHLKEITIWWAVTDDYSIPVREPTVLGYGPDDSTEIGDSAHFRRAQLEKLQIRVENGRVNYCLDYWACRAEFTKLKVLKLEGPVRRDCTDWSNIAYAFPSLETFVINTWQYYWYADRITHEDYQDGLAHFLRRLKPLTRLRITGIVSKNTLRTILERHGSSVRQLWLETNQWPNEEMPDPDMVQELCARCTQLEDLKLPIIRTAGNVEEVNMYRSLGSIPTLRQLHLTLDYFPSVEYDGNAASHILPTEFIDLISRPTEPRHSHCYKVLRTMFINHALDEGLAKSIFTVMDASRASTILLESLIIQPVESWHPEINISFEDLFREVGRTYYFARDLRGTHRNEIKVKELNQSRRMRTAARLKKKLGDAEKVLFDQLWPPQQRGIERGPWYDEWCSFPLANVAVGGGENLGSDELSNLKWIREVSS